jgi:hypothetical protein
VTVLPWAPALMRPPVSLSRLHFTPGSHEA